MSIITDKYRNQVLEILRMRFPNMNEKKIQKMIDKTIEKKFQDKDIVFFNSFTNDKTEGKFLEKITNKILKESDNQPIITGNACLYKNHYKCKNYAAEMVDYFLKERKVAKAKEFEFKNTNPELSRKYKVTQSLIKVIVNSYFGVFGEGNSFFYDRNVPESITYNGAIIITTSIMAFEMLFASNLYFKNINILYDYVHRIIKSNIELPIEEYIEKDISVSKVAKFLYKNIINKNVEDLENIKDLLNSINDQSIINRIYYKNNLLKFIDQSSNFKDILKVFVNENSMTEKYVESKVKVFKILEDFVFTTDFFNPDRAEIIDTEKRKNIIVCDTDSNFLYLNQFYEVFATQFAGIKSEEELNDSDNIIKVISKLVDICQHYIAIVYKNLLKNMNVPEAFRSRIVMKSEFIYSKVMLTKNKRWYSGKVLSQENVKLIPPVIDIKGLPIKKISTTKYVRDRFQQILEYILSATKIDLSVVIKSFMELENDIYKNLENGNRDFLIPSKLNELSSYKNPYTIRSIKGMLFWNALHPFEVIHPPDKVDLLYITKDPKLVAEMIKLKEFEPIKELLTQDDKLKKYGFEYLSIPKSVESIPQWLIPYIDYNTMIITNISNGLILLESCNIKTIKLNKGRKTYTNIVSL